MNEYIRTELKQPVVIENIITVHYFEYTKNFAFSGEAHDFWEIVFADKGDLYITAGNSEFLLRQGQMFIHRPMEFHNIRCDGKTASNSVIVTFSCAAAELFAVAGSILRCGDETRDILAAIISEAKKTFSDISFSDICTKFSLSASVVKKLFSEKLGCGAMEFFSNCKIERAKQLIREDSCNITEIAETLSYSSVYYFSRAFKKSTGMTPTEYAASVKAMYEEHSVPIPAEEEL